ncbi:phosphodiesterase [Micromonospora sp. Llam0]|uniref:phosphodiesterase n=1 Tax=Micromonospora sp. Llam0 TaxID=2485143 RepID=UPI001F15B850|nr:phosphodiesterase [Micromonospora sp. Llam0]
MTLGARLARVRGGRLLHPRGCSFTGEVQLWGPLADWFLPAGRWPAVIRFSRGTPTPPGWPDILGLAVRIQVPDRPVDLLVSSAGRAPVLRHLPLPRRDFATTYGSILSLRHGRHRIYLAASPATPGRLGGAVERLAEVAARRPIVLRLAAATATSHWRTFGRIDVGEPLPSAVDAALAFDPTGHPPLRLRTGGLIQRLRTVTYAASRRARGASTDDNPIAAAGRRPLA